MFTKGSCPANFNTKWSYVFVLVAYKTAKYIFLYIYIEIQTNVLAWNPCGNDVTRETAKSLAKYTELHIYVSLIYGVASLQPKKYNKHAILC